MYASGRFLMNISVQMSLRNHVLNKCGQPSLPQHNLFDNAIVKNRKNFRVRMRPV